MSEVVALAAQSGAPNQYKKSMAINFGSIPGPFCKEVTGVFAEADVNDLVAVSPSQALAAGVVVTGGRVTATGVIGITIATPGGTTVTPNTVTLDVYVTKGGPST